MYARKGAVTYTSVNYDVSAYVRRKPGRLINTAVKTFAKTFISSFRIHISIGIRCTYASTVCVLFPAYGLAVCHPNAAGNEARKALWTILGSYGYLGYVVPSVVEVVRGRRLLECESNSLIYGPSLKSHFAGR